MVYKLGGELKYKETLHLHSSEPKIGVGIDDKNFIQFEIESSPMSRTQKNSLKEHARARNEQKILRKYTAWLAKKYWISQPARRRRKRVREVKYD